ncbi:MAG TPA: choice-of-anchor Q domain-containing protein [Solirubrobacteraceae bacterium]|nr:choice-of-anchor Q domain-containing protein [Solirubrobacteraceae bacterium]
MGDFIRGRRYAAWAALPVLAAALSLGAPAAAQATTWTVTSGADSGGTCPGSNCTLRDAVADAKGGDVISLPATTITLSSGPIAIGSDLTLEGMGSASTVITASPATQLLSILSGDVTVKGIAFNGASATGPDGGLGGAIYNQYGDLHVIDCSFTNDDAATGSGGSPGDADGWGGAIFSSGRLFVSGSTFTTDSAAGAGGASGDDDNTGGAGGAIYIDTSSEGIVSNSTFIGDTAAGGAADAATTGYALGAQGGAIYAGGELVLSASTFSGNVAQGGGATDGMPASHGGDGGEGGAVYAGENAEITASTFNASSAPNSADAGADAGGADADGGGRGGAIDAAQDLTLTGSTVRGNSLPQDAASTSGGLGGGVYVDGDGALSGDAVTNNAAPGGSAGGIYINNPTDLTASTLSGNTAASGGGLVVDGPAALANDTIAQNTASDEGGGIYDEETAQLANVTLDGNIAHGAGGGGNLYVDDADLALHDSIVAGSSAASSGGNCAPGTSVLVSLGDNAEDSGQCGLTGPGDQPDDSTLHLGALSGSPLAVVPLQAGSSAINTGDPAGCTDADGNLLTVDELGTVRPQGGRCDIGAFEYIPPAPAPSTPPPSTGPPAAAATAPALSGLHVAKGKLTYHDSQAATTAIRIVRLTPGARKTHGACKALRHGKRPKHTHPCTRRTPVAHRTHTDKAGTNTVKLPRLRKGRYQLTATPTLGHLTGRPATTTFKAT